MFVISKINIFVTGSFSATFDLYELPKVSHVSALPILPPPPQRGRVAGSLIVFPVLSCQGAQSPAPAQPHHSVVWDITFAKYESFS